MGYHDQLYTEYLKYIAWLWPLHYILWVSYFHYFFFVVEIIKLYYCFILEHVYLFDPMYYFSHLSNWLSWVNVFEEWEKMSSSIKILIDVLEIARQKILVVEEEEYSENSCNFSVLINYRLFKAYLNGHFLGSFFLSVQN